MIWRYMSLFLKDKREGEMLYLSTFHMLQTSPPQTIIKHRKSPTKITATTHGLPLPTRPPPPDSASSLRAPHWAEDVSAWRGKPWNSASYTVDGWKLWGFLGCIVQLREKSKVEPFENGGFERWCFFFKWVICRVPAGGSRGNRIMNDQLLKEVQDFNRRLYQCMTDLLPSSPENQPTTQNLIWYV